MDLDIMASVCEQIIGNCLCVLGDAMAMPIGSMIKHFRDGVRGAHRGAPRANGLGAAIPQVNRGARGPGPMLEPAAPSRPRWPTSRADRTSRSRSTAARSRAPEGAMLVDAAKYGDVEIPVFCYEPKLGQPVGACRMCLVEIEGIPKLQTALLDAGQGRHGRPHADAARARGAARGGRVPARSTTRSTARSATRAASARCRTSPTAGARARRASSSPSATSRSRSSSRR